MSKIIPGGKTGEINRLYGTIMRRLMTVYVLFYLCIFPSCVHNKYFDILGFRFALFWKPTFVLGIIAVVLGIAYLLTDRLYNGSAIHQAIVGKMKEQGVIKCLKEKRTRGDLLFLTLLLTIAISTAFAEYPYEAFWGNRGRNYGLLLWLMYGIAYVLITRFYRFRELHFYAFLVCGLVPCIWGICNFFMITFGFFEHADPEKAYSFASSIGNINTYTNYVGMLFGGSAAAYVLSDTRRKETVAYLVAVISLFAGIMGKSDNVILWIGAVFCFLPFLAWNTKREFRRYCVMAVTVVTAMTIVGAIVNSGIPTMNDVDPGTLIEIGRHGWMAVLTALLILVALGIDACMKKVTEIPTGRFRKTWGMFLMGMLLLVILFLIFVNTKGLPAPLESFRDLLIFSDAWGTGRGLGWRLGMEYWRNDTTLFTKLFGYGPDTYYIITMDRFMNIMQDAGYGMFDSAHNEYFEYFITIGIVGVLLYIAFLVESLKKAFGNCPIGQKCIATAVMAYAVQATVNIAIPITTVIFMLLIMILHAEKDIKTP